MEAILPSGVTSAEARQRSLRGSQFARIMKSVDVIRLAVDGAHCVAILNIDTVFGPVPFAEHIRVANGGPVPGELSATPE